MDMSLNEILTSTDPSFDEVDTSTALTKRERLILQRTWSDVCSLGKAQLGVELFLLQVIVKPY